jgi:hypothetical protein
MSNHEEMLKQAERIRNNFKDLVDQPNTSEAQSIRNEIEGLVSDLRAKKDGRSIENRLKNLEHHLKGLNQEIMDFRHSNQIAGMCEDMRQHTRDL